MMKSKLLNTLMLAALALPGVAMAEDAPPAAAPAAAKPVVPTLSDILDASGLSVTGYIDVGYTSLNTTGLFASGVPSRVFDAPDPSAGKKLNSFNLNQASITVSKQPKEGFGGVINLTAGQDSNVIASFGAGNLGGNPFDNSHNFDVTQAYGSYVGGPLTVIAGKFVTLAGAEVIASPSDVNYSRSILFGYAIPFTHTGARVTYAVADTVNLIAGINNGWDQVSDTNKDKTIELGFTATPIKIVSLAGVYYSGKELTGFAKPLNQASNGNRQLVDLVATITATDKLSFVFNYDDGSQDNVTPAKAKWNGLASYANYQLTDLWRLSFRNEYFDDKDGFRTGIVQKWKENTLALAYLPTKNVELRGEIRRDTSNTSAFLNSDGTSKSSQSSFGLEALYKF
ncbi:MAG TPA: outer membrane beta-barrel protein [Gallionella sp.]|nr:outer membrane beta-barrel protein [Gallionella sp.]